jgi:hypothetical protein
VLNKKSEAIETGKEIILGTGFKGLIISSTLFKIFYGIEVFDLQLKADSFIERCKLLTMKYTI